MFNLLQTYLPIMSSMDSFEILNPNALIAFLSSRASIDLLRLINIYLTTITSRAGYMQRPRGSALWSFG